MDINRGYPLPSQGFYRESLTVRGVNFSHILLESNGSSSQLNISDLKSYDKPWQLDDIRLGQHIQKKLDPSGNTISYNLMLNSVSLERVKEVIRLSGENTVPIYLTEFKYQGLDLNQAVAGPLKALLHGSRVKLFLFRKKIFRNDLHMLQASYIQPVVMNSPVQFILPPIQTPSLLPALSNPSLDHSQPIHQTHPLNPYEISTNIPLSQPTSSNIPLKTVLKFHTQPPHAYHLIDNIPLASDSYPPNEITEVSQSVLKLNLGSFDHVTNKPEILQSTQDSAHNPLYYEPNLPIFQSNLGKTHFELEEWKHIYSEDKIVALPFFFERYDLEPWSIWCFKCQVEQKQTENPLVVDDLFNSFLKGLEPIRHDSFGFIGLLGEEPQLIISGVLITRGSELPLAILENPDCTYKVLNVEDPEDKSLIEDHWTNNEENDSIQKLRIRISKIWK